MLKEVLDFLKIKSGSVIVDATVGHAGHAEAMLKHAGEKGTLIALDWDEYMLTKAEQRLKNVKGKKIFAHSDYRNLSLVLQKNNINAVDAILFDFGVNIEHFQDTQRGFSFQTEAPLDMRMDRSTKETAASFLNRATQAEIAYVIREYGGEKWANAIAREIIKLRKQSQMKTTQHLINAVLSAIPPKYRDKRIHPATRTFQAIRIAVNRELEDLEEAILNAGKCLNQYGRMVTLSYHSGEDRAAKNAFKELERTKQFHILTKKPIKPSDEEIAQHPESRSARLRAIERTNTQGAIS